MPRALLLFGGQAGVANAADFGTGYGDLEVAVAGDLLLQLLVETGFEFTNLAAAETSNVDVIARAVGFVVVAIAAEMKKVEFVNKALALEQINGAVDGDEVDVGIDFLRTVENLVDIEVLLGGVHDPETDAALASEAYATVTKGVLEMTLRGSGVDAFAGGDAVCGGRRHGASPRLSGHELGYTNSVAGGE